MGVKTFTHNSPSHSQELLDKLNALRGEGHFCDVTIRVQGQLFSAHKVVLACCSDFLKAKLSGKLSEEEAGAEDDKPVLDLHHVTVAGFAPLLEYAYTSTLSISTENIIDVLAAASYMQMFAVANTCSEFMKSSILWNASSSAGAASSAASASLHRPQEAPEGATGCTLAPLDALSPSPVSSECSVAERPIPVCRESRRKRKGFASPQPTSSSSPQVPNPSPSSSSFPESSAQTLEPSLAFSWTYPFGVDRRFASEKAKLPEGLLESAGASGQDPSGRALVEYLSCEGPRGMGVGGAAVVEEEEEDVQVKVERLSDEEVHEEASQPVSASHSSLSDQQTVPGSEHAQEDLLISPQSSSIGSMDEGVTEGLQSIQGTPNTTGHMEEDDRLENVQYPYHLYISPSARPGLNGPERPFQCPTCGVRFTRIQNLKQHMLIHSGIKPFQCDRCGKKFTRAYSLKMHRLKHEGKRCFRCQICSATFTSFGEYKHHMRVSRHIIRKPRIYECKTCGAMFTNSGNLIVHLRSLNHEASELANYFQTSEFLLPDYLSHMQEEEESLAHFEMTEQAFETAANTATSSSSSSSVQTPVISQVSSTMNYDPHPPAPPAHNPGSRAAQGGEAGGEGTPAEQPKNAIAVTSLPEPEEGEREKEEEGRKQKKALVSITIE
ncbi:zinc finger and BTB domain-containing protein 44 isoform X1 [Pygocentrus nattereri]|uniref:Zinc finger and BTB domain-containing protein 44 n=1 Tax=Pygocentrus nattereri TaxID=42514 RepID=A0A3B4DTD7_PYGNA|nr:zinc finger and BTB domain-containing protein 44 isoform X1 [Pygocentrus nattereri]XP_017557273.1 zinc finger and BTB domain-containing protein 44 isoform X1 [Pygocentrus nattereri]